MPSVEWCYKLALRLRATGMSVFRFFVSPNLHVFIYFQPFFGCFRSYLRAFRFSPSVSGFLSGTDWHPWCKTGSVCVVFIVIIELVAVRLQPIVHLVWHNHSSVWITTSELSTDWSIGPWTLTLVYGTFTVVYGHTTSHQVVLVMCM